MVNNNPSNRKRIVQLGIVGVIIMLISLSGQTAYAQTQREESISLSFKDAPLPTVLIKIEELSSYKVSFTYDELQSVKVTIEVTNGLVEEILRQLLKGTKFTYSISGKNITITKQKEAQSKTPSVKQRRISGFIKDDAGAPIVGATIYSEANNQVNTMSGADGSYSLMVPAGIKELICVFMGSKTQKINLLEEQDVYNIQMETEQITLDDVVVTGVFVKAKESYTGAVTTINEKELKSFGNRSLLTSISNIDPSFNLINNLEFGSDPNHLPDIALRGQTSMNVNVRDLQEETNTQSAANLPLFILDGFEISLQRMMDMDNEMIQSITILKDASATALYGSRGANGIVVITSKRPEPGKLTISYRGTAAVEAPDFSSYNLMNSKEKLEYERLAKLYESNYNNTGLALAKLYNQRLIDIERGIDTYWLKYPVRVGISNRHSLRVEGGSNQFNYSANIGYNNVEGVMKRSSRENYSGNIFLQYNLKNIKFQNDLTLSYNKSFNSPYGAFSEYATMNPIYTPYDENGNLKKMLVEESIITGKPQITGNPLYNASLPYKDNASYTNITNNFAIEWSILPELFIRGRLGIIKQDSRSDKYLSREHTSFETSYYTGDNYKLRGSYNYATGYNFSYEGDITVNYNKLFNNVHQVYAGLNFNCADEKAETYGFAAQGFSALNKPNIGMASSYAIDSKPTATEQHSRRFGTVLNLNYTYNLRYFVDFSGKFEGSSKFGADKRIAPFWSSGIGWNLHNEKFLKESNLVNTLRLRFSYGTTGSQNFSSYQALTTFRYFTGQTYEHWTGAYMIGLGNKDLSWQKTNQTNVGLETVLFNRRLRLNIDYYNKVTNDLLTDINLPTAAGFPSYKANVGEVRNRGVEFNANVYVIRNIENNFTWSIGGSLVHNENKILKISNSLEFLNDKLISESGSNPSFLFKEGESMNTIYVVKSLGIDPATGKEIYLDKDGVRTYDWNASDKIACGVSEPKIWGNINTMLRYKNLSFNAVFSYRMGQKVYNQTLVDKVENITNSSTYNNPWRNLDKRALYDRWQKPGDVSLYKDIADLNTTYASSRFIMEENSIRLNSVNFTYDLKSEWLLNHLKISYVSIGAYAEDLFHVSTIKQERGSSYPFSRKYSLSLTVRF